MVFWQICCCNLVPWWGHVLLDLKIRLLYPILELIISVKEHQTAVLKCSFLMLATQGHSGCRCRRDAHWFLALNPACRSKRPSRLSHATCPKQSAILKLSKKRYPSKMCFRRIEAKLDFDVFVLWQKIVGRFRVPLEHLDLPPMSLRSLVCCIS